MPQGRPALDPKSELPPRPTVDPWQVAPVQDDQLRNPLYLIPPDQRPRVLLRYTDQRDLLVSGLLDGGGDIAQRPILVDSRSGRDMWCCSRSTRSIGGPRSGAIRSCSTRCCTTTT
ncbi:MAG: hypothetical protein R2882_08625 [Gemmatimonadales bacterium]